MLMTWAIAAALAAQTAATAPQQKDTSKRPEPITITGCVERADQVAGANTLGTTLDSLSFVLLDMPRETAGTSGSSGAAASPATPKGYRLDGDVEKLNPHVGHRVEIVGFVDEPAPTNAAASAVNGPKVKVESIRMVSETCAR
jgi:hypothetical protein